MTISWGWCFKILIKKRSRLITSARKLSELHSFSHCSRNLVTKVKKPCHLYYLPWRKNSWIHTYVKCKRSRIWTRLAKFTYQRRNYYATSTSIMIIKNICRSVAPNWFLATPNFGISKILLPLVISNSYIFKIVLPFAWWKFKRSLTWSLNKTYQTISCDPPVWITDVNNNKCLKCIQSIKKKIFLYKPYI